MVEVQDVFLSVAKNVTSLNKQVMLVAKVWTFIILFWQGKSRNHHSSGMRERN